MTVLMHRALNGQKRWQRWERLAGYTVDQLRVHLEALFVDGMSWGNMGAWHIDHVRPRNSFSFVSADDSSFRECWALTNLQPLWATDNIRKGARLS